MAKKTGACIVYFLLMTGVFLLLGLAGKFYLQSRHWQVTVSTSEFSETSAYLDNDDRGFYYIYGFYITDEDTDLTTQVRQRFAGDRETTLAMVQINLQNYSQGAISERGLVHLEELFTALEETGKHYLIRFLYDWDGENEQREPQSIEIILEHIRQAGEVLQKHKQEVFVIQGLFIGNWGEMNGTKYLAIEDFKRLSDALAKASDPSDYLAVRMPSQWRTITELRNPDLGEAAEGTLTRRLSLYNDGIMGNEGDYGTYGTKSAEEAIYYEPWCREDELAFQDELCKWVPNGGEIMMENPYNDFENALRDLARMHVTYLNKEYDAKIYEKWKKTILGSPGCYEGMDGLSYIERHLGYRILIREAELSYDRKEDALLAAVRLQNVGFAPVYTDKLLIITLCGGEGELVVRKTLDYELRLLTGGEQSGKTADCGTEFSLSSLPEGVYSVYFQIEDAETETPMQLANEQEREKYGYRIGTVTIIR
ncbi:MAG: DUF4832 domain-containing protein [Roseburia sp.]|nr:DUF4832 domain-containing protein [Roseburia sp.]